MRGRARGATAIVAATIIALAGAGCKGSGATKAKADQGQGLQSSNADVRREKALELGRRHYSSQADRAKIVEVLTALGQSDPEPLVRSACLEGLATQDKEAAVGLAKQLIADTNATVRWDATKVLATSDSAEARDGLLYVLRNDSSKDARQEAAQGLGRFKEKEVVKQLVTSLGDRDRGVAVAAYRSLEKISGEHLPMRAGVWEEWMEEQEAANPSK